MGLTKKQAELLDEVILTVDFHFNEGDNFDVYDLEEYANEVVVDEITDQGRWDTYKRKVLRYGDRFIEVTYSQGSTEMQDHYSEMEITEVFAKEKTVTVYE